MNKPIYTMTDAELQAENNSLHCEIDRLSKALADIAEEKDELKAKYGNLVRGIKELANSLEEEERAAARERKGTEFRSCERKNCTYRPARRNAR